MYDKTKDNKSNAKYGRNQKKGKGYSKKNSQTGTSFKKDQAFTSKVDDHEVGFNNPTWYAWNPGLLRDSANFPFPSVLGLETKVQNSADIARDNLTTFIDTVGTSAYIAPGVMNFDFAFTYGQAEDILSPLNVAAQNIYSFTRKDNSGYANYDSCDQMTMFIAMDSIYALIALCKKIYGTARLYNLTNRYSPNAWLATLGLEASEVQSNMAQFRARLNSLIFRAASIYVPGDFTIFDRHEMMCEAYYTDVDSLNKSQTYTFTPVYFYRREDTTGNLIAMPTKGFTQAEDYLDLLEYLIQSVLTSQDIAIMSGDIRKAWTNYKIVSPVNEDYIAPVIFDPAIRSMIENSRIYNVDMSPNSLEFSEHHWDINQTRTEDLNGYLKTNYRYYFPTHLEGRIVAINEASDGLLNMHHDNPEPLDVMYATRLVSTIDRLDGVGVNYHTAHFGSVGTEVIVGCYIYEAMSSDYVDEDDPTIEFRKIPVQQFIVEVRESDLAEQVVYANFDSMMAMSAFDWHPIQYFTRIFTSQGEPDSDQQLAWSRAIFDSVNYTTIPAANIKRLNEVALLALFKVPQVGVYRE